MMLVAVLMPAGTPTITTASRSRSTAAVSVMSGGGRAFRRDGVEFLFEGVDEGLGRLAQPYAAGAEILGEPLGLRADPDGLAGELPMGGVERRLQDRDPSPDLRQGLLQESASRIECRSTQRLTHDHPSIHGRYRT